MDDKNKGKKRKKPKGGRTEDNYLDCKKMTMDGMN